MIENIYFLKKFTSKKALKFAVRFLYRSKILWSHSVFEAVQNIVIRIRWLPRPFKISLRAKSVTFRGRSKYSQIRSVVFRGRWYCRRCHLWISKYPNPSPSEVVFRRSWIFKIAKSVTFRGRFPPPHYCSWICGLPRMPHYCRQRIFNVQLVTYPLPCPNAEIGRRPKNEKKKHF